MRRDALQRAAQEWMDARPGEGAVRAHRRFEKALPKLADGDELTLLIALCANGDLSLNKVKRATRAIAELVRELTAGGYLS